MVLFSAFGKLSAVAIFRAEDMEVVELRDIPIPSGCGRPVDGGLTLDNGRLTLP